MRDVNGKIWIIQVYVYVGTMYAYVETIYMYEYAGTLGTILCSCGSRMVIVYFYTEYNFTLIIDG